MKTAKPLILILLLSLLMTGVFPANAGVLSGTASIAPDAAAVAPISKDPTGPDVPATEGAGAKPLPDAPEDYPILACEPNGMGGDRADLRGIVFTPPTGFSKVVVRMAATVGGQYTFDAELRRSGGFMIAPEATISVTADVTGNVQTVPYTPVTLDFGSIAATGNEAFSLRFTNITGEGLLFFEVNTAKPCPNLMETEENNVDNPTERHDPAGFKVLAGGPTPTLVASLSTPVIDGVVSFGEWDLSQTLQFANGLISVRNDGLRLYVLLDVLGDNVEDNGRASDYYYLTFDKNKDALITPNVDLNYGFSALNDNIRYQYYLGPGSWTGLQPDTFSSRGTGFGCFFADGTLQFKRFPFGITCLQHRVFELAIDLDEIGAAAGGSVKMGVRVGSPTPTILDNIPENFTTDFSNLITVVLAAWPGFVITPVNGAVVHLEEQAVEVTQAIQDRNNSVSLVANKKTAARVYVDVNGVAVSQTAKAFLYASTGGVDKPGSPMVMWHAAPTTINRNTTGHTANFTLPASWDQGDVTFSARSKDLLGNVSSSTPINLAFISRDVPNYWIVPINTGTNATPVLASNAEITGQESYQKAIYPVQTVNFTRKPWQDIGPTTVGNTIAELNQYHTGVVLAWLLSVIFTGKQPYILPDQIYGFTPSGGGISDPVWLGAGGYVARGFRGTSAEGTMGHEMNHNLDRDANGTWGRHVPGGCGAGGPDPAWPYANDDIQETGFDIRSMTAVPSNFPDVMSYCQSGSSPTKWISPYRWNNLFGTFTSSLNAQMLEKAAPNEQAAPQVVYYVSGHVSMDGSGVLDPALTLPGVPTTGVAPGEYAVEVLALDGGVLYSLPFKAVFGEMEPGEIIDTIYFSFQIPADPAAHKLVLRHNQQVLDEILITANAPVVTVTSPNGGETWQGQGTVTWDASDADGDPLTFTVLYSPDGGEVWFPVDTGVTGNSLDVNTSGLPGSANAKIKVIATDGANTGEDTSNEPFTVGLNPPSAFIISPGPNGFVKAGTPVSLEGDATDPEDGVLPDGAFYWSEGESVLGIGRQVTAHLEPGWHTLTLTVVDSQGGSGEASVQIFVGDRIYAPVVRR